MNFRWNKKEPELDLELLRKSRVPILTLDKIWHEIFPPEKKTKIISNLEEKLTGLLKEQGKLNHEHKEYMKLKKKMMDQILALTTEAFDHGSDTAKEEMAKNQKYILEINEKIESIKQRLEEVPKEIQKTNALLLEESIKICYNDMKESQVQLDTLNEWIQEAREILKQKLVQKTYHEEKIERIYSYLHNLVGPEFIEQLDEEFGR